jgi:hypothetical protein
MVLLAPWAQAATPLFTPGLLSQVGGVNDLSGPMQGYTAGAAI